MKIKKSFVFVVLVLFLITLVVPSRICQFFAYTAIFIFLASFIYAFDLSKKITVERPFKELKTACNEKIEISFNIKNNSRFTAHLLYYRDTVPYFYIFGNKHENVITLHKRENKKVTYTIKADTRGEFIISPVVIETSDPLNLFSFKKEYPVEMKLIVRPARIKLITATEPGIPQGEIKIQNICYEDTTLRKSIREYKNGDEQKRINWRMSAKYSKLFTNQYENSYDAPFFVFLNLAEDDYDLKNRTYYTEKAIEIAASIVEKSKLYRQNVGFAAYAQGFPYLKPAKNQVNKILDMLAVIKPEPGKLSYNPFIKYTDELPAGTLIFSIDEKVVREYFVKVEADKENINSKNIGAMKK